MTPTPAWRSGAEAIERCEADQKVHDDREKAARESDYYFAGAIYPEVGRGFLQPRRKDPGLAPRTNAVSRSFTERREDSIRTSIARRSRKVDDYIVGNRLVVFGHLTFAEGRLRDPNSDESFGEGIETLTRWSIEASEILGGIPISVVLSRNRNEGDPGRLHGHAAFPADVDWTVLRKTWAHGYMTLERASTIDPFSGKVRTPVEQARGGANYMIEQAKPEWRLHHGEGITCYHQVPGFTPRRIEVESQTFSGGAKSIEPFTDGPVHTHTSARGEKGATVSFQWDPSLAMSDNESATAAWRIQGPRDLRTKA